MGRRVTSAGRRCSPPHIGAACALVPLLWCALAPRSDAARPVGGAASARPLVRARRVAPKYPLYKQCDDRWGADVIATKTLCQVGCLISSTSEALAGWGVELPGDEAANPGSLLAWLHANEGLSGDDFVEGAIDKLVPGAWPADGSGMHKQNDLDAQAVAALLSKGLSVIANVRHGRHFVLTTAVQANATSPGNHTISVNDSGFDVDEYSLERDVVGWRIFAFDSATNAAE